MKIIPSKVLYTASIFNEFSPLALSPDVTPPPPIEIKTVGRSRRHERRGGGGEARRRGGRRRGGEYYADEDLDDGEYDDEDYYDEEEGGYSLDSRGEAVPARVHGLGCAPPHHGGGQVLRLPLLGGRVLAPPLLLRVRLLLPHRQKMRPKKCRQDLQ